MVPAWFFTVSTLSIYQDRYLFQEQIHTKNGKSGFPDFPFLLSGNIDTHQRLAQRKLGTLDINRLCPIGRRSSARAFAASALALSISFGHSAISARSVTFSGRISANPELTAAMISSSPCLWIVTTPGARTVVRGICRAYTPSSPAAVLNSIIVAVPVKKTRSGVMISTSNTLFSSAIAYPHFRYCALLYFSRTSSMVPAFKK